MRHFFIAVSAILLSAFSYAAYAVPTGEYIGHGVEARVYRVGDVAVRVPTGSAISDSDLENVRNSLQIAYEAGFSNVPPGKDPIVFFASDTKQELKGYPTELRVGTPLDKWVETGKPLPSDFEARIREIMAQASRKGVLISAKGDGAIRQFVIDNNRKIWLVDFGSLEGPYAEQYFEYVESMNTRYGDDAISNGYYLQGKYLGEKCQAASRLIESEASG